MCLSSVFLDAYLLRNWHLVPRHVRVIPIDSCSSNCIITLTSSLHLSCPILEFFSCKLSCSLPILAHNSRFKCWNCHKSWAVWSFVSAIPSLPVTHLIHCSSICLRLDYKRSISLLIGQVSGQWDGQGVLDRFEKCRPPSSGRGVESRERGGPENGMDQCEFNGQGCNINSGAHHQSDHNGFTHQLYRCHLQNVVWVSLLSSLWHSVSPVFVLLVLPRLSVSRRTACVVLIPIECLSHQITRLNLSLSLCLISSFTFLNVCFRLSLVLFSLLLSTQLCANSHEVNCTWV